MKIRENLIKQFNQDCCIAMESGEIWDTTPFLKGINTGTAFAKRINLYLLNDKSYSLNKNERIALAKVYTKYHKLLRKASNE